MGNLSNETFLSSFNATVVDTGSTQLSIAAALLSDVATAYTGGIALTNADASITIWVSTVPVGAGPPVAAVGDAGSHALLAGGPPLHLPMGDLMKISAVAASGTPRLSWVAVTL